MRFYFHLLLFVTAGLVAFAPLPVSPIAPQERNFRIDARQYAYSPSELKVNAGDTVTYPNGWEKYIVVDAAIQALLKEESDTRALMAERERIEKEIREAKEARDMATPKRVVDVMMTDLDVLW